MTKIYFVRHAQPDFTIHDDLTRPLTEKGIIDSKKVTEFLLDKHITRVFSSPCKRSIHTIKDLAEKLNLQINIIEDFKERKIDDVWIEDFDSFVKEQWNNFDYKLSRGESLNEVQRRNTDALYEIVRENTDRNIVIGTHGTALSTLINYYNKDFGYSDFERIKHLMPFIVCVEFQGKEFKTMEEFSL